VKPAKPRPDFPLFPHASGKWAKKIAGKLRYFGRWADPDGALAEYQSHLAGVQKDSKPPRPAIRGLPLADACNLFLMSQRDRFDQREIASRTYREYVRTCKRLLEFWGRDRRIETLLPEDFTQYKVELSKTCNLVSVGNEVTRVKTLLNWLERSKHTSAIEVGPDFRKPPEKAVRRHRRQVGKKLYTAHEVQRLIGESGVTLRAMIHLGINCGFGNSDCESLPLAVVAEAIDSGLLDYARPKTEVDRLCPLWPETVEALRTAMEYRATVALTVENAKPTEHAQAFLLADGRPLNPESGHVAKRFRSAREAARIKRGGFYWLRHTFETVAGLCGDQVAVNAIMGHVDGSMAGVYREEVQESRLLKASAAVREWLYLRS